MAALLKKLLIGTSVAVGMSAVGMAPAFAGSLTNATIGGSAANDYLLYGVSGNQTVVIPNNSANLQSVLTGNAASPTGNVELAASSEKTGFDFSKNTTLTGNIGGLSLSLSSLTFADWTADLGGGLTFGRKWFNDALINNGYAKLVQSGGSYYTNAWNLFSTGGTGFQRFSDPNISYVNQDATGKISIGLAGHYDATPLLFKGLDAMSFGYINKMFRDPSKLTSPIQASEIVKYAYNGTTGYLYNFSATASGLTAKDDGISHSGNYEVSLAGVIVPPPPAAAVPEPSTMLGLMAVGGLFGLAKRNSSKKA